MSLLFSVVDLQIAKYARTGERKRGLRVKASNGDTLAVSLLSPCASLDDADIAEAAADGVKVTRVCNYGNGEAKKVANDTLTGQPAETLAQILAMTETELKRELSGAPSRVESDAAALTQTV